MAEPKAKLVNGNHSPEKKQSQLWQLLALAKEVTKDIDTVQGFEKLLEDKKALEQDIEAKQTEAQTLRQLNDKVVREFSEYKTQAACKTDTLFSEFEHKYKLYESNKAAVKALEEEVAQSQARLSNAETARMTDLEELRTAQEKLAQVQEQNRRLTAETQDLHARHKTDLADCEARLSVARSDLGEDLLHELDAHGLRKLGLDLQALSTKCHNLAKEYCSDPQGAKDSGSEIQELRMRFPHVPLTTSSTPCATQMRCAVAEAVIAEALTAQIFIPFYLPNGVKSMASKLLEAFGTDERRRAIYRCQMLRCVQDAAEVTRIEDDIVRKASNEVRTTLHPLVVVSKQAAFYSAVPTLFREALRLWARVQRSWELVSAEAPLDANEVSPPGRYGEYDEPAGRARKPGPRSVAAVLFPQVATREDIIFQGMALWSDQSAVTAAALEAGAEAPRASSHQGGRRKSIIAPETPIRVRASG